jgi:hypothetical protein
MATFTTEELDTKEGRTYTTAELDILENQSLVEDKIFSGEAEITEFAPIPIRGILDGDGDLSARLTSGLYYTRRFGVPLEQSFDLVEQLGALHYGEEMPAATLWGRVKRSYQGGKAQTQAGDLAFDAWKQMLGDPEAYEKSREQIDKLMSKISPDYWQEERSFIERMLQESADVTPFALAAGKQGAAGAVIGGGITTALGVGPVPGIKWGGALGAAERVAELETGLQLISLMQMKDEYGNRIDPNIAWAVSGGVGLLNGAIEVGQIATLASTLGISTKIFENAAQKATARLFAEGTLRQIAAKYVAQFGYTLSAETAQELVQEGVAITGDYLAVEINNLTKGTDIKPATGEEITARLLETAEKSAMAFAPMVVGGMGIGGLTRAIIGEKAEKAEGLRTTGEMKGEYAAKKPIPPISELAAEINKASERIRAEKGTFTTEELQTIAEKALAEIPKAEDEEHQTGINRLTQLGQKASGVAQGVETPPAPTVTTPQGEIAAESRQEKINRIAKETENLELYYGMRPRKDLSNESQNTFEVYDSRQGKDAPGIITFPAPSQYSAQRQKTSVKNQLASWLKGLRQNATTAPAAEKVAKQPPAPEGKVEKPQWKYEDYSDWSRRLAKNNTVAELEKQLKKIGGEQEKAKQAHLRAIEKSTSMQGNAQQRAQAGIVVRGNYEEMQALKNALEIHKYYPDLAKQATKDTGRLKGGRQAGGTILFSPEEWKALLGSVSYHIKRGAKTLEEVTARIVAEVGEWIRPYVQQAWDEMHKTVAAPPEKVVAQKPEKAPPTKKPAKGIERVAPEQEEARKRQHQRIRATKETKGLTEKRFKELKREVTTSGKAISMTRMTQEELDAFEKKVKRARPKTVKGSKVLILKTERQIQTLKENLTRKLQMTEDAWRDILDREVQGREPKYIDAGHFITQTEGRAVIKRMHNVASILKVVQPYEDAIGKNAEIAELVGNIDQQVGDKYHPDPKSLESMRYYAQQSEMKTGAPIFSVFQALSDAHAENRRTQNAELKTLEVAVGEEAFAKIASDEKALKRISDYIDSKSHLENKPPMPADITEEETKIAQAIEKIFEKRQIQCRVAKFFNYYYYDQPIAESERYKKEIKKALDIYDTQGEEELWEYLKTQEWGIKHSGYDPTESMIRKIRIYDPKPTTVGKSHIQISQAIVYHEQEKNIFQRLASYTRQMDTLVNMSPLINSLVQLYQDNADKFSDWKTVEDNVALYLQELKGYNAPRNWIERWSRRIWAQTAQTLLENSISIFSYNLIEETALGADKSTIFDPRNKALSPEREAYRETYCQQQQAMLEQFFMVNEKALFFLEPLNRLARRISLTAHSDVVSRSLAFWGKINQVDRALTAETTKEMANQAKFQDMSLLEQRKALAILAKDGKEAMAKYVARVYTDTTHALYERSQRSPAEMGQGQALANLMLFPRMYTERLVRAAAKVLGKDVDPTTRYRGAKIIVSTVLGGALLGMLFAKVTGRRDNPYNPLNIIKWRFGGLYLAGVEALNELYITTIQLFEGDDKQKKQALNDLPAKLTKVPEMFVPFYAHTIRGIEKATGTKYIDRYAIRSIRELLDEDYKMRPSAYEFNKDGIINGARYILQGRSVDIEEEKSKGTGVRPTISLKGLK